MCMAISMKQSQQQKQRLTQQQRIFLEMLQWNREELTAYLEEEYQKNPLLDFDRRTFCKESSSFEHDYDYMQKIAVKETLSEHLIHQIGFLKEEVPKHLAEFLIDSLDKNGYLQLEPEELKRYFPQYTEKTLEIFIQRMQQMEPTGIFARNLKECLLLQLEESESVYREEGIHIAKNYLYLLAENKLPEIGKQCGYSMEKVKECVKLIRSLQPKPASGFVRVAPYLQCEVGVSVAGERLEVEMLNNYEALQLCPEYYMEKDQKTQEFVRPYLQQIKQLFDMLNARERTLCLIATAIVENQKDFFLKRGNRKPLTLREIAEQVGIHESTISRAISGKALRFENRAIPFKYFFTSKTSGGDSKDAIAERMKILIAQEDKKKPLSDQKLADILKKEGLEVARRTVAKYREQLGIPSASIRKDYREKK